MSIPISHVVSGEGAGMTSAELVTARQALPSPHELPDPGGCGATGLRKGLLLTPRRRFRSDISAQTSLQ